MRILVTGATGFVGSYLLPALQPGVGRRYSRIVCWSRDVHGDVLSRAERSRALEAVAPDAVIHLAWLKTGTSAYELDPANHLWASETVSFAEEVVGRGSRFLGMGSMIEGDPGANSPYAVAKRHAAEGVLAVGHSEGLSVWLRPSWIFDFLDARPRVLREAASSTLAGVPFRPRTPQTYHDFVHVQDVAGAIRWALDNHAEGPVEICSWRLTSVATLVSAFDAWHRASPQAHQSPRTPEDPEWVSWAPHHTSRILAPFWAQQAEQ